MKEINLSLRSIKMISESNKSYDFYLGKNPDEDEVYEKLMSKMRLMGKKKSEKKMIT